MTERKWAPIDSEAQLAVISEQFAEMPDAELAGIKARLDAEAAKRQPAAKAPDIKNLTRHDVIKLYGFDPGWR